jgi:hypothetical protein
MPEVTIAELFEKTPRKIVKLTEDLSLFFFTIVSLTSNTAPVHAFLVLAACRLIYEAVVIDLILCLVERNGLISTLVEMRINDPYTPVSVYSSRLLRESTGLFLGISATVT